MPQASTQPTGIFICYRRDDSSGYARALYEPLCTYFGEDRVFMDLDQIEPGEDFEQVIDEAVSSCETLVVLIGRDWLTSRDENRRRLDDPKDFVRLEIAAALQRYIRVIPVLVQGATMPRPEDLPDELSRFSRRQAFELSDRRWRQDVRRLIDSLERTLIGRRGVPRINVPGEEGLQRQEAEERPMQAVSDEPHVRAEEVPLPALDARLAARQPAVGHETAQAKARFAPSKKQLLVLARGGALCLAATAGIVLIIRSWVITQGESPSSIDTSVAENLQIGSNNQLVQPTTLPIGQAEPSPIPGPTAAPKPQPNANLRPTTTPTPKASPADASTPEEHYKQGNELWSKKKREAARVEFKAATAGDNKDAHYYDAHYYLGLYYITDKNNEDRKLNSLRRADMNAALQHFQLAQRGRRHVTDSRRYERRLKKELDRLKMQ